MLEQLYSVAFLQKRPYIGLLLGFSYAVIGIALAAILFKDDPALITVAFIALLSYPTVKGLLRKEQLLLKKSKDITLISLLRKHKRLFFVYLFLFLGILLGYSFFSMLLPSLATNALFANQISIVYGTAGQATLFTPGLFQDLFFHNLRVLSLVFVTSLFLGEGGILLLVWNASVWGTVFGKLAQAAASSGAMHPALLFLFILAIVLPHTLLEGLSYIIAAFSGGVVSKASLEKHTPERKIKLFRGAATILLLSMLVLGIGMFVEQYVLINNQLYQDIIMLSGLL